MCRRSRAKMDQALPPLFVPAGQRSYVDYCAEGGRSLGTRLCNTPKKRIEHGNLIGQFIPASHEFCYLPARAINTRSNYTRAGEEGLARAID